MRTPTRLGEVTLPGGLDAARILIVCGSGGVGKTTVAAALGAVAAVRGRRVLVLTIDPARRLADALGLDAAADQTVRVPLPANAAGTLSARMLDRQAALDRVIARHAPTPERREAILNNRFYQQVSSSLVGAHEYVAMEELGALADSEEYDLLVLDTPPSGRALHFLDAPGKIASILEDRVFRAAVGSFAAAGKLSQRGLGVAGLAMRGFSALLGTDMLRETLEFLVAFQEMFDGFGERARSASRWLKDPRTAFVVVATPYRSSLEDAALLGEELQRREMHLRAAVVNRLHADPGEVPGTPEALAARLVEAAPQQFRSQGALLRLLAQLKANHGRFRAMARSEAEQVGQWAAELSCPVIALPRRTRPIHDVDGLLALIAELQAR